MYCRNCGAGSLDDKATVCTECGIHPLTFKNHCQSCGVQTKPEQVVCISCGVALASKPFSLDLGRLQNLDVNSLIKKPALISASIAFLFCFFAWVKMDTFGMGVGFSLFSLSHPFMMADTILAPALLYILPVCLIGIIVADFSPTLAKFKRIFGIASLVLVAYAAIGLYQLTHPSAPDSGSGDFNSMYQRITSNIMDDAYSIGFGFYVSFVATLATAFFSGFYRSHSSNESLSKTAPISILIILILVSCKKEDGFSVGQNDEGGIIFYVDESSQHGLVAAPADLSFTLPWNSETFTATGATGTAIGTGETNTATIIDAFGEAGNAAFCCDTLTLNGYADWFLPSLDELYRMYEQKDVIGGLVNTHYWTSSDSGNGSPWNVDFTNGYKNHGQNVGNHLRVRAVRSF